MISRAAINAVDLTVPPFWTPRWKIADWIQVRRPMGAVTLSTALGELVRHGKILASRPRQTGCMEYRQNQQRERETAHEGTH